jgi:hypothetical protein
MKYSIILPLLLLFGCMKGKKVDLIIHNAIIHTVNDMNDVEEAMAIKDGKIVEVGPERQILNKYRYDESIDMMQSSIYPPFNDGNFPLFSYLDSNNTNTHQQISEIEDELLQQGIDKVQIQNVTYNQLKLIIKHTQKYPSVLKYTIFLKDELMNLNYIKRIKNNSNSHLRIQGISINNLKDIDNSIIRAKAKKLQIQISNSNYQIVKSKIKNQLYDYSRDHRWIINCEILENDSLLTEILLQNLFIICSEKTKSAILTENQLYSFGRGDIIRHSIFPSLKIFQKNNKLINEDVLKSITNWTSYLSFLEKNEGTIEKNKYANFIVFPKEINFSEENKDLYISQLFHKGKNVYSTE